MSTRRAELKDLSIDFEDFDLPIKLDREIKLNKRKKHKKEKIPNTKLLTRRLNGNKFY